MERSIYFRVTVSRDFNEIGVRVCSFATIVRLQRVIPDTHIVR